MDEVMKIIWWFSCSSQT